MMFGESTNFATYEHDSATSDFKSTEHTTQSINKAASHRVSLQIDHSQVRWPNSMLRTLSAENRNLDDICGFYTCPVFRARVLYLLLSSLDVCTLLRLVSPCCVGEICSAHLSMHDIPRDHECPCTRRLEDNSLEDSIDSTFD